MTAVVVGGGIAGASAALRLAQGGQKVVLLEGGESLGGLVVSFSVGGTPLECFYHHVFPHEHEVISLIDELGLTPRMEWLDSSVGVLTDGKVWPFTSPLDLLRFGPLKPHQRVHAGLGALRLGRAKDWRALDTISALDWLRDATGAPAAREIWEPLLRAKFGPAAREVPAAWMWGRINQRLGARKGSAEKLGYLRGGFRQLFDALADRLVAEGVEIRTSTRALSIVLDGDTVTGVETPDGVIDAETVVYTGALPGITRIVAPEQCDPRWQQPGLGVVVVVLEMDQPVSDIYWTNVCDDRLPFGGIIEHTNMLPRSDYAGRHVVYLSRYYTQDEAIAQADPAAVAEEWLDALETHYAGFSRSHVLAVHPFKAPYAAPLVTLGHLGRIPPRRSHLRGLYVCTTGQIYPQDRGMSEGVRTGAETAAEVLEDLDGIWTWQCPVCGGHRRTDRYAVQSTDTENGVAAEAFRPSADRFGETVASVVECLDCGHGSLSERPSDEAIAAAYGDAVDEISLDEERGQVETASRALAWVEETVRPGSLLDIGCWTGSLVEAADRRGWQAVGLEPSAWAVGRARERGLHVAQGELADAEGTYRAVALCDVLEHLLDPAEAVARIHDLLEPGGVLYLTVPDASSRLARAMGKRWWSVLPMHVQYFTRPSLKLLLEDAGLEVVSMRSHPKVFTVDYYAQRLGGYSTAAAGVVSGVASRLKVDGRLIAPDFHDRVQVLARRPA